jgi:cytochrome c-type biogenesis protein CcmH
LFVCLFLAFAASGAAADDPALEKRAMALSEELRCLVCQNQTIADSNAELAVDLRKQVREQLAQGKSDEQVIGYMVARYGDFVLYRPPVKETTWLLWFGPLLLLVGGVVALAFKLAKPRPQQPDLPPAELARAESLLDNKDGLR